MKILWLKSELLHPVDKGGKIRTYQMLKHLKNRHDVTYLSLVSPSDPMESFERATEYCNRLVTVPWRAAQRSSARFYRDLAFNIFSPLPFAIEKYRSLQMQQAIERECRESDFDVVVCDFLVPSINLSPDCEAATVLFQHNVESLIWQRHYQTETGRIKKAFFHSQWQKMLRYEGTACRRFDAVVAVSEADREMMRDQFGLTEVYDVPTGVDTEYFTPQGGEREQFDLVFTGSMDWMPNEDAIVYFVEEILPRISSAIPTVTLTVVGRNPSKRIQSLATANPQISVTGRVDDVRPYIDRAAAYIVPIRIGGGTRLKIYEAMAMRKPVISTSIGAEGLPVRDGEELLIADDAESFAQAVIRTLTENNLAAKISEQARKTVCERFDWSRAAEAFASVCELAAGSRSGMRAVSVALSI